MSNDNGGEKPPRLSQTQKAELHRRVAAHRADPSSAVPWELVRAKLFSDQT